MNTTTDKMLQVLLEWNKTADRRAIFLDCYSRMTGNMLEAIGAGRFGDARWVEGLLHRFADYYFDAVAADESSDLQPVVVWQKAFNAARDPESMVLQNLLLGVNAHINYDLVLALDDMLRPEWSTLSESERDLRHRDHCQVNRIIAETVDVVQDEVVERHAPALDLIDRLGGRADEWLISKLIEGWRDDVWDRAVELVQMQDVSARERIRREVEQAALRRADLILWL